MSDDDNAQDPQVGTTPAPAKKKAAVKKAAKKKAAPKVTVSESPPEEDAPDVVFRSRLQEPREFTIMNIRACRNAKYPGHCEWHVPADQAERFARHPHVQRSRVVRIDK